MSFYEKHDPTKLEEVPKIMAKYYGDYPKLVKRLERRYQDYGYFQNWEQDEAPMKIAMVRCGRFFLLTLYMYNLLTVLTIVIRNKSMRQERNSENFG